MDEAVDAFEVHERAEIDDVRDLAFDDFAGLEAIENLIANFLALLSSTARRERTTLLRLRLSSMTLIEGLAHELVEVVYPTDVHQRSRQEATDAKVDDETALDDFDDVAFDGLAGFGGSLDLAPCLLEARTLLRKNQPAFGIFFCYDEGVDLFAEFNLFRGVDGLRIESSPAGITPSDL